MTNSLPSGLTLRTISLPSDIASTLRNSYFRQAKSDSLTVFAIFTLFGAGFGGMVRWWFVPNATPLFSLGVGILCGLLAGFWMAVLDFSDWPSVRKDLAAGDCVELAVTAVRAFSVRFQDNNAPGVALDCGQQTLVLIGNWWLNDLRLELWTEPETRTSFPANCFKLRYLPISRRILSVEITGNKLHVQQSKPIEPLLELRFSRNSEVEVVNKTLDELCFV